MRILTAPLWTLQALLLLLVAAAALVLAPALALAFLVYLGVMFNTTPGWAVLAATGALLGAGAGLRYALRALRQLGPPAGAWPRSAALSLAGTASAYLLIRLLATLNL